MFEGCWLSVSFLRTLQWEKEEKHLEKTTRVLKGNCDKQLSSDQNPFDIPLFSLVNRDPYNGLS